MAESTCTDGDSWPQELAFMKDLEELMKCPICFDFMQAPMMLPSCDHNYCSLCIRKYFTQREQCPTCGSAASSNQLRSNHIMEKTVQEFKKIRQPLRSISVASLPSLNQLEEDVDCSTRLIQKRQEVCHPQKSSFASGSAGHSFQGSSRMKKRRGSSKNSSAKNVPVTRQRSDSEDSDVEIVSEESNSPFTGTQVSSSLSRMQQSLSFSISQTDSPKPKTVQSKLFSHVTLPGNGTSGSNNSTKENMGGKQKQSSVLSSPLKSPPKIASPLVISHGENFKSSPALSSSPKVPSLLSLARPKRVACQRSLSTNDISETNKVPCPVCGISVVSHSVNRHLDLCLASQEKKAALCPSEKRKPLPKLVYNLLSDKDIRKRLKELGLNSQGNRQVLIKRHHEFTLYYNADCDSLSPKDPCILVREFEETRKLEIKLSSKTPDTGQSMLHFTKNSKKEDIEEAHKKYALQHKSQFQSLIREVKNRMKSAKNKDSTHASSSSLSEHSAEDHDQQHPKEIPASEIDCETDPSKETACVIPDDGVGEVQDVCNEQDVIAGQTSMESDSDCLFVQSLSTEKNSSSETTDTSDAYSQETDNEEEASTDLLEADTGSECVTKVFPAKKKRRRALRPSKPSWHDTDVIEQVISEDTLENLPGSSPSVLLKSDEEKSSHFPDTDAKNTSHPLSAASSNKSESTSFDLSKPQQSVKRFSKPVRSSADIAQQQISSKDSSLKQQSLSEELSQATVGLTDISEDFPQCHGVDFRSEIDRNQTVPVGEDKSKEQAYLMKSSTDMPEKAEEGTVVTSSEKVLNTGKKGRKPKHCRLKSSDGVQTKTSGLEEKDSKDGALFDCVGEQVRNDDRMNENEVDCNGVSSENVNADESNHFRSNDGGNNVIARDEKNDCIAEAGSGTFELDLSDCEAPAEKQCTENGPEDFTQIQDDPPEKPTKKRKLVPKKKKTEFLSNDPVLEIPTCSSEVNEARVLTNPETEDANAPTKDDSQVTKLKSLLKKKSNSSMGIKKSVRFVGLPPRLSDFQYEESAKSGLECTASNSSTDVIQDDVHSSAEVAVNQTGDDITLSHCVNTKDIERQEEWTSTENALSNIHLVPTNIDIGQSGVSGKLKDNIKKGKAATKSSQKKGHKYKKDSCPDAKSKTDVSTDMKIVIAESNTETVETCTTGQLDEMKGSHVQEEKDQDCHGENPETHHNSESANTENILVSVFPTEGFTSVKEFSALNKETSTSNKEGTSDEQVDEEENITEHQPVLSKGKKAKKRKAIKSDICKSRSIDKDTVVSEQSLQTGRKKRKLNKTAGLTNVQDITPSSADEGRHIVDVQHQEHETIIPEVVQDTFMPSLVKSKKRKKRAIEAVLETCTDFSEHSAGKGNSNSGRKKKKARKCDGEEVAETTPSLCADIPGVSNDLALNMEKSSGDMVTLETSTRAECGTERVTKKRKISKVNKKAVLQETPETYQGEESSENDIKKCKSRKGTGTTSITENISESQSHVLQQSDETGHATESTKKVKNQPKRGKQSAVEDNAQHSHERLVDDEKEMLMSPADAVKTKLRKT